MGDLCCHTYQDVVMCRCCTYEMTDSVIPCGNPNVFSFNSKLTKHFIQAIVEISVISILVGIIIIILAQFKNTWIAMVVLGLLLIVYYVFAAYKLWKCFFKVSASYDKRLGVAKIVEEGLCCSTPKETEIRFENIEKVIACEMPCFLSLNRNGYTLVLTNGSVVTYHHPLSHLHVRAISSFVEEFRRANGLSTTSYDNYSKHPYLAPLTLTDPFFPPKPDPFRSPWSSGDVEHYAHWQVFDENDRLRPEPIPIEDIQRVYPRTPTPPSPPRQSTPGNDNYAAGGASAGPGDCGGGNGD